MSEFKKRMPRGFRTLGVLRAKGQYHKGFCECCGNEAEVACFVDKYGRTYLLCQICKD